MSRLRRGLMLAVLAGVLGFLAAADVAKREAAVREQLAPLVDVAVARRDLEAGRAIRNEDLATRRVPARFAPADPRAAAEFVGRQLAVAVPRGADVHPVLSSWACLPLTHG